MYPHHARTQSFSSFLICFSQSAARSNVESLGIRNVYYTCSIRGLRYFPKRMNAAYFGTFPVSYARVIYSLFFLSPGRL